MSLPNEVIDLIWAKLSVTYGHRFLSVWDGMPDEIVKADWAEQLSHVSQERILWALSNLPDRAPDAPTFRQLCGRMPEKQKPFALPAGPKRPAPLIVRQIVEAMKANGKSNEPQRVRWARAYIAKWTAPGAMPTIFQRDALYTALRVVEKHEAVPATVDDLKAQAQQKIDAYGAVA